MQNMVVRCVLYWYVHAVLRAQSSTNKQPGTVFVTASGVMMYSQSVSSISVLAHNMNVVLIWNFVHVDPHFLFFCLMLRLSLHSFAAQKSYRTEIRTTVNFRSRYGVNITTLCCRTLSAS